MKKRNVSIQAAVAILLGAASVSSFAGIAQGLTASIAREAIVDDTTLIGSGSIAYSTSVPLPLGSAVIRVTLGGGATFTAPAGPLAGSASLVIAANPGAAVLTIADGTVSADQTTITFPLAVTVQSAPVNVTFTFKPTGLSAGGGAIENAAFLATAVGNTLPVTMSIGTSAATPADIDTASTSNVVTSVAGLTSRILASSAFTATAPAGGVAETKKIEVTTGAGVAMTNPAGATNTATASLLNFGGIRFTTNPLAKAADGTTAFTLPGNFKASFKATAAGNFSAVQGTGGKVFMASDVGCTTQVGASATVTASAATFTTAVTPASNAYNYVCMQLNTSNAVSIAEVTPSLSASIDGLTAATATYNVTTAPLYALVNNGASVLVKSYIPAAASGYTSFIRVINTGSVAAAVSGTVVNQTTGVAGTRGVIVPTLAPGASVTLTSTQVEAGVGAIADANTRPTLLVTAPTTLKVQSFILTNGNGNFAEVSGQE